MLLSQVLNAAKPSFKRPQSPPDLFLDFSPSCYIMAINLMAIILMTIPGPADFTISGQPASPLPPGELRPRSGHIRRGRRGGRLPDTDACRLRQ